MLKDQQLKFIELRASGLSYEAIAKKLNTSKQTLINWSKELQADINNAKTIQRDNLLRNFSLEQDARLERLCKLINKLWEELEQREFSSISTLELLDKLPKLLMQLSLTTPKPVFKEKVDISKFDFEQIKEWPT